MGPRAIRIAPLVTLQALQALAQKASAESRRILEPLPRARPNHRRKATDGANRANRGDAESESDGPQKCAKATRKPPLLPRRGGQRPRRVTTGPIDSSEDMSNTLRWVPAALCLALGPLPSSLAEPRSGPGTVAPRPSLQERVPVEVREETPKEQEEMLVVEVLASSRPWGKGEPTAGVAIIAGLGSGYAADDPVLARGTTNAKGLAELQIPCSLVEAAKSDTDRLWARIETSGRPEEPGWMEQTRHVAVPRSLERQQLKVLATRGWTVRGRLFDVQGAPTSGNVEGRAVNVDKKRAWVHGSVDEEGWFEMHASVPGNYDLVGLAPRAEWGETEAMADRSLGVLRGVKIDPESLPKDLRIQFEGAGIVRGKVQTSGGEPVAGLEMRLRMAELVRATEAGRSTMRRYQELRWEGLGGCEASFHSGADGTFEIRGLRPGDFELYGPPELPSRPVATDGEPIIIVHDHPHLVVRVVDEQGKPVPPGFVHTPPYTSTPPTAWPERPRIVVATTSEALAQRSWVPFHLPWISTGREDEAGVTIFEADAGADYWVELVGGPVHAPAQRVSTPPIPGPAYVELKAGPAPPRGRVSVSLAKQDSEKSPLVAVQIEDLASGRPLYVNERSTGWPFEMSLPVGEYQLAVEGRPVIGRQHGILRRSASVGRFEARLRIAEGQTVPIVAAPPAGARIDLELSGRATEADKATIRAGWRGMFFSDIEWQAGRAEARLLAPGKWPRSVGFKVEWTGTSSAGTHLGYHISMGTRQTSEIVPAGDYTLLVLMPGGRTQSAEVSLIDGVTTPVKITFPE